MKHVGCWLVVGLVSLALGCEALLDIVLPSTVTVTLINGSSDHDVEVSFIYDDEDDIPEFALRQLDPDVETTIGPGEAFPAIVRDCDDLQAMIIDRAELQAGILGPDAETEVLRIDDDYECGDEIVFTFTHSALIMDFDVSIDVQPGSILP